MLMAVLCCVLLAADSEYQCGTGGRGPNQSGHTTGSSRAHPEGEKAGPWQEQDDEKGSRALLGPVFLWSSALRWIEEAAAKIWLRKTIWKMTRRASIATMCTFVPCVLRLLKPWLAGQLLFKTSFIIEVGAGCLNADTSMTTSSVWYFLGVGKYWFTAPVYYINTITCTIYYWRISLS